MRVVSNTSPLCHAVWINEAEILPALFETILIPRSVADELSHPRAPEIVRSWIHSPPSWLVITDVEPVLSSPELAKLHRGELAAIQLALQTDADLILLDEKAARRGAADLGLRVMGLLGVLDQAGRHGLIDVPSALERLIRTEFYISRKLLQKVLAAHQG